MWPLSHPFLTVVTQRPFSVHLQLQPVESAVVRGVAAVVCVLTCPEAIALSGARSTATNGTIVFDSLSITGTIGASYQIRIGCELGIMQLPSLPPVTVTIDTCPPGTEPDDTSTQCRSCPLSTYSVGGRTKCQGCPPAGAICSSGRIILQPGFFPANTRLLDVPVQSIIGNGSTSIQRLALNERTLLYPCWNEEACVLNQGNHTYGCATGYTGPLCGVCDVRENYVRSGQVCTECWPHGINVILFVLFILAVLAALTYIAAFQSVKEASPRKIVLRILLSYIQMLSSLGQFQAQATQTFREVFQFTETVGGSFVSAPPLQCVLRLSYYTSFALNMGLPFLMIPLSIGLAATTLVIRVACSTPKYRRWKMAINQRLRRRRTRAPGTIPDVVPAFPETSSMARATRARSQQQDYCVALKHYLRHKAYLAPTVFVLFVSYNVLSTTAAKMFKCRPEVIDGQRYLETDLAVQCYDSSHIGGMVAASCAALLFNVGMPMLLWLFLRRHKHRLREPEIFSRFGFLYQGYSVDRGRYAWECIVLLRKFIIVMVASIVEDPWYQAIAGISIVVIACGLHLAYRPYDNHFYNRLETSVLSVLAATQVISLVYLRAETVPMTPAERSRMGTIVTLLLVSLNGAMLLTLLLILTKHTLCLHRCWQYQRCKHRFFACLFSRRGSTSDGATNDAQTRTPVSQQTLDFTDWVDNPVHGKSPTGHPSATNT